MTAVAEKVGEWMAGIVVVTAERETVVRVTVNVHTKSVHARGSQTLHVAPLEAHFKGPLTPGAIPPRHAGHGEGWEGNFEKARAHLLRMNSQHCFPAWLGFHLLSFGVQKGFSSRPQA